MKIRKIILLILIISGFFGFLVKTPTPGKFIRNIEEAQGYDKVLFYNGLAYASKQNFAVKYRIAGGILPHHNLASFIQADVISRIEKQGPKSVILIGPNHYEKGRGKIISSDLELSTPFGPVNTDSIFVNELSRNNGVVLDNGVLSKDHSILSPLYYLKFFLPDTLIVPIIVSRETKINQLMDLSYKLAAYMKKTDAVILASVDFSHNRNYKDAKNFDRDTYASIKELAYEKIMRFDNSHLDSPPSIILLLQTLERINAVKNDILLHTNSAEITRNYQPAVTSYFSILFYEK